jgi:hypothetical protein
LMANARTSAVTTTLLMILGAFIIGKWLFLWANKWFLWIVIDLSNIYLLFRGVYIIYIMWLHG